MRTATLAFLIAAAGSAHAQPAPQQGGSLTYYATRAAFDVDNPALFFEDFEDVHIAGISCWSFSPIDTNTDDACYDPGTLPPPLVLAAVGPTQHAEDALIALGAGYFGQPSTVVGANLEVDATEVRFDPGMYAVGMVVYAYFGNPGITVDVYDTAGALLGSTTIPGDTTGTFFGVRSDATALGAIRLDADDDYTMIDDVAAGGSAVAAEPPAGAAGLALSAPSPNPSGGEARLVLTVTRAQPVRLAVYDARGREVAVLVDGVRAAGRHEVAFDGRRLPSGEYLVRLEAGGHAETRRLTLVR